MTEPRDGDSIAEFLSGRAFAVVGASRDRSKYGNRVLRAYLDAGKTAYPVNPREEEIEGLPSYPDLASLPGDVHGVSIITPPAVTETIVEQAAQAGIERVWMQPGAESDEAVRTAQSRGLEVIAAGPCVLVELGRRGA